MPVPPLIRKRWIESRLTDELGRPIRVPEWMYEHLIRAIDGYKAWRRGDRLCDRCGPDHGRIFDSRAECERAPHAGCDGLAGHKITTVLVNLGRQQGKSTGLGAYVDSELVLALNSTMLFLASAEDATEEIYEAKIRVPLERNPRLEKKLSILGTSIRNRKKGNKLKFIATGLRSAPGGTWRRLFIDEATLVPNRIIGKLLPTITAAHGRECVNTKCAGYTTGATKDSPTSCPKCRRPLEEFFGVVVLASSADEPTGVFHELLVAEQEDPTPNTHMFVSQEKLNAHASDETTEALERTWGRLPSMKGWKRRELDNVFTREGDEFLPDEAIKDILRKENTGKADYCEHPCVGFLDCSRTGDLMSLVIGADLEGGERPFAKITGVRVDVFDPADYPKHRIRYAPDPHRRPGDPPSIREHLVDLFGGWLDPEVEKASGGDATPNRFPGLLELWIDTTRWEEAKDLYDWARSQPWGSRARAYNGDTLIRSLMWKSLEQRALRGRSAIELPWSRQLEKELRNAAIKMNDKTGVMEVYDSQAGNRRLGQHRDIAFSVGGVCWRCDAIQARGRKPNERTHAVNRRGRRELADDQVGEAEVLRRRHRAGAARTITGGFMKEKF